MEDGNFYATLKDKFSKGMENPFLTVPYGVSFSYGDIDNLSAKIAGALKESGAKPGDRIVVQVEKSPANVALYIAAMRAGLVYVPLNTAYTAHELDYFLSNAEPTIFICDPLKENTLTAPAKHAGIETILTLGVGGNGMLTDAAQNATPENDICMRHADDLAVILYTSGTTGRSKGAMLSHGNLQSNALALNSLWGFTSQDVLLHALPTFHIHGLFVALHTAMLSASEILFLPKFDVNEVRHALPRASV
ncbi:MAG: AMP-binding protein, partial [Marinicaulis sp.]|nr:AMP-binding protein [Marinicaulis sp.]